MELMETLELMEPPILHPMLHLLPISPAAALQEHLPTDLQLMELQELPVQLPKELAMELQDLLVQELVLLTHRLLLLQELPMDKLELDTVHQEQLE